LIDQAANEEAKIVLLPELFNTDYACYFRKDPEVFRYAEPIPGPTTDEIARKAKEHGIYVISPIFEKAGPGVHYNTAPIIDPEGKILGKYRKTHIPLHGSREKYYFRPASEFPVFETAFGNIGILICYDSSFPEVYRILTLEGAEIVFAPTAVPYYYGRDDPKRVEMRVMTRARDNAIFVVMVNRVGKEENFEYYGNSLIVDPKGNILSKAGNEKDAIVIATIDLEEVTKWRLECHILRDIRPEIYGRLTQPKLF